MNRRMIFPFSGLNFKESYYTCISENLNPVVVLILVDCIDLIIDADQDLVWHNLFAYFTKIVNHRISNLVVLSQSGSHYKVKVYSICLVQCRINPKNDTRHTCVNTSRIYTHTHLRFRPSVDLQAGVCTDSGSWAS